MGIRGTVPGPWADGYEASKRARQHEEEPDGEPLVDDAFYCSRCGQPINRHADGSDKPSSGGQCNVCASTGTVIG